MLGSDTLTLTSKDITNNLTTITTLSININLILPQTPAPNNVSNDAIVAVKEAATSRTESAAVDAAATSEPGKECDSPQQANAANAAGQPPSNTVVNTNAAKPQPVSKPVSNSTVSSSSASAIDNATLSPNSENQNITNGIGDTNPSSTTTKTAANTAVAENTTNQNFNDLASKVPSSKEIVTEMVKKMSAVVANSMH